MGAYRLEMKLFIVLSALLAMLFTASATGAEQPLVAAAGQDERVAIRYLVLEDDVRLPPILLQDC